MSLRRHALPLAIVAVAHVAVAAVPVLLDEPPEQTRSVVRIDFSDPPPPEPESKPEPEPEPDPPPPEPEPEPEPVRERPKPVPTPQPQPDPMPEPATPQPRAVPVAPPTPEPEAKPEPSTPPPKPEPKPPSPTPEPPPKSSGKGKADMRGYAKGIYGALQGHQRYPAGARRLGLEGKGAVKIKVDRRGRLVGKPSIHTSTGHDVLDNEALAMVERAAPFDAPPGAFDKDVATLVIPVRFKLKKK